MKCKCGHTKIRHSAFSGCLGSVDSTMPNDCECSELRAEIKAKMEATL